MKKKQFNFHLFAQNRK